MDFYRKLKDRNYVNFLFGWQQNTELGLENRFILPVVAGKILLNNNHQRLLTGAGLSYNLEESSGSTSYASSLEGMLIIFPSKNLSIQPPSCRSIQGWPIFPGLSDWAVCGWHSM
jgi:hypothetical protein